MNKQSFLNDFESYASKEYFEIVFSKLLDFQTRIFLNSPDIQEMAIYSMFESDLTPEQTASEIISTISGSEAGI